MTPESCLELLKMGNNCFITGPAGSGKTYLLQEYINWLKKNNIKVAVTASTGIAATHLGGVTIHSWSGLGIRDDLSPYDLEALLEKKYLWQHFDQTAVLIIDEISMLSSRQLDAIDLICRNFKKPDEPFGGMQLVLSGDFFQLPPIVRYGQDSSFAYTAKSWKEADIKVCLLSSQFRQTDQNLYDLLTAIRGQYIDKNHKDSLISRIGISMSSVSPVRLFTHNIDVDGANDKELERLPGLINEYQSAHKGNKNLADSIERGSLIMPRLRLKMKAKVMFIKNNFEQGIANGTLGQIVGFNGDRLPIVLLSDGREVTVDRATWTIVEDDKVKAEVSQLPLRLAWAMTVHKSQGITLEAAEIDLSKAFTPGMGYVALSRVRTFEGLKLIGFNEASLKVHEEAVIFEDLAKKIAFNLTEALKLIPKSRKTETTERFVSKSAIAGAKLKKKISAHLATALLLEEGLILKDLAKKRGVKIETILTHLEKLKEENILPDIKHLKPANNRLQTIHKAFFKTGSDKLSPVKSILPANFSFEEIRLARLFLD